MSALPRPPTGGVPSTPAERTRRQAGLFFGGALFVIFSAAVTRRSLARRYRPIPTITPAPGAHPTNPTSNATVLSQGAPKSSDAPGYMAAAEAEAAAEQPSLQTNGPLLAFEALTVATLNVVSWAIMLTGGALWALDIGNMEDLRRKVRGGLGVDGTGRGEKEVEEEMEEWIVGVLAHKEQKEKARGEVVELKDGRGRDRRL